MSRDLKTHLTTEEFVRFVTDDLSEETEQAVDRHVAQCEDCATELARFYNDEEAFPQARWAAGRNAFVAGLRASLFTQPVNHPLGSSRLTGWLRQLMTSWREAFAEPGYSANTGGKKRRPVFDWRSEDGGLSYSVTEEINGDWYVLLESLQPEMEGQRLRLRLGSFQQEVTLEKVIDGEFAAELVIPRASRPEAEDAHEIQLEAIV
jgi:hypothetical protein